MSAIRTIAKAASALKRRASAARARRGRDLPCLWLFTDSTRLADPLAAIARLPRGSGVILRHYVDAARDREALALRLARACRRRGLILLVAGDVRLARAIGADGLHLPEWQLRKLPGKLRRPHAGFIVTCACHSPGALHAAARAGVDAAFLAPVFATASHPDAPCIGALHFAAWVRASRVPVFALGGIGAAGARRIRDSGAAGIGGIGFAQADKS